MTSSERKKARWLNYKDEHQCSECKEIAIVARAVWDALPYDYCPWCAAEMTNDTKEE